LALVIASLARRSYRNGESYHRNLTDLMTGRDDFDTFSTPKQTNEADSRDHPGSVLETNKNQWSVAFQKLAGRNRVGVSKCHERLKMTCLMGNRKTLALLAEVESTNFNLPTHPIMSLHQF
jgi:hypothetical protein